MGPRPSVSATRRAGLRPSTKPHARFNRRLAASRATCRRRGTRWPTYEISPITLFAFIASPSPKPPRQRRDETKMSRDSADGAGTLSSTACESLARSGGGLSVFDAVFPLDFPPVANQRTLPSRSRTGRFHGRRPNSLPLDLGQQLDWNRHSRRWHYRGSEPLG